MSVIIINPNSTVSMTEAMLAQAQRAAPHQSFDGWTSHGGPPSIQGVEDGEIAKGPLLQLVDKASKLGADGIIIGCFDDIALDEAVALSDCPVIGIGQAAYHYAALRKWRFSVVTTLSVSVPIIEENIRRAGLSIFLSKVRASEVPVLDLDADPKKAAEIIKSEALLAQEFDEVSAIILGCAGMVEIHHQVEKALSIKTIDPVSCAARCWNWLS
jgi:allantoin racemase